MKSILLALATLFSAGLSALAETAPTTGLASWYGEDHRGKLMANGKRFDPDKLTAASWFYPLGTKLRVTMKDGNCARVVQVTVTDRGPHRRLVRDGRIIDLAAAAFRRLAAPELGLVVVQIQPTT